MSSTYELLILSQALLGGLLVAAGISDLRSGRVDPWLSVAAVLSAAFIAMLTGDLKTSLLGLAVVVPFAVAWLSLNRFAGGADLKLTAAAALAVGWPAAAGMVLVALAIMLITQGTYTLRRTSPPTVYCLGLAGAYLLVTLL